MIILFTINSLQAIPLSYPLRVSYIHTVQQLWPPILVAQEIGIPGYADDNYNVLILSHWTYSQGPLDAALLWSNPLYYFTADNPWGTTNHQIQKALRNKISLAGKKIMVSAFGAVQFPTSANIDPFECASKLALFVKKNNLDGVDIDWRDEQALISGKAQQWLINFQSELKSLLPKYVISHSPHASYFKANYYQKANYLNIQKAVGMGIDFYNVKFYARSDTKYDTYEELFTHSTGQFSGTSVNQIADNGISKNKLIVGKMIKSQNSNIVSPLELGSWALSAFQQIGWYSGIAFWQFSDNLNGTAIKEASQSLINACQYYKNCTYSIVKFFTIFDQQIWQKQKQQQQPPTQSSTQSSTQPTTQPANVQISYPVRFGYVNSVNSWWGDSLAAQLNVPGFGTTRDYKFICFSSWTTNGPFDVGQIWSNPTYYFPGEFGSTKSQIQAFLKSKYREAGISVLISAFGAKEFPVSSGLDPVNTASSLATFVKDNSLDGVDVAWEDSQSMFTGTGEQWLINFQTELRRLLPNHIITHSPKGSFFKQELCTHGGYMAVHRAVGITIDFYNVQFYNQGDTEYNSYAELFLQATGQFNKTSVQEIIQRGVPSNKVVVGKPTTQAEAGFVEPMILGEWFKKAYQQKNWYAGMAFWPMKYDPEGKLINQAGKQLKELCNLYNNCT